MVYYGFVYIWYDTKNKKYLIGSHHGKVEDSYTTSTGGKYVKNIFKSRPHTMKRKILEFNIDIDDWKYTQQLEQKWLNFRPNISNNKRYYNQKQFATGGIDKSIPRTKSKAWCEKHSTRQKKLVQEGKHNFTSDHAVVCANKRINEGTHHFLKSDFNKKPLIIYKNSVLIDKFESKVEAVRAGYPAHVIDKIRKFGFYITEKDSKKSNSKKGDKFENRS